MAFVLANRVLDTTTTTGTGTLTLDGSPPSGYQAFSAIGDGNSTYYTVVGGSQWEVGIGTYTAAGTIFSRDTVLSSSAGGTTKVSFSAGTKSVFVDYPSERAVGTDLTQTLTNKTIAGASNTLTVRLGSDVSGTLPVANGGTGITSFGTGVATFLGTPSSANLAAALTDETGSGLAVFNNSPSFITPTLGVATATSVNKVALTAPASGSTLTIADGKTLTASNSLTLVGTDSTTMTFPPASVSVGYLNIPQVSKSINYTTVLADSGKHIFHPASDDNPRTYTINSNANVAYEVGTAITFVNLINTITIAITSDTMYLAGVGSTGSRTLAAYGSATALKVNTTAWVISGVGLT